MMMTENDDGIIVIAAPDGAPRLDVFASEAAGFTRSAAQRMIESGLITVNGASVKAGRKLKAGETVEICPEQVQTVELVPQDIPLDIVYQDADIAVINKPQGMVVHPAAGNPDGTLVNAVMYHIHDLSGIGGELRPGIVHRIDKNTSGLIVIAKNDKAHESLSLQLREHSARRIYAALAEGNIKEDEGRIDAPIARHRTDRKRMAVTEGGKSAVTNWRVLRRFGEYTLMLFALETGRTHQIRVHAAYIKHPLAGDAVYGREKPVLGLDGQALHAAALVLTHPSTGERVVFTAPLPEWFERVLKKLGMEDASGTVLAAARELASM